MNYQIIKGKVADKKLSATLKGDVLYITLPYSDEKNFILFSKYIIRFCDTHLKDITEVVANDDAFHCILGYAIRCIPVDWYGERVCCFLISENIPDVFHFSSEVFNVELFIENIKGLFSALRVYIYNIDLV